MRRKKKILSFNQQDNKPKKQIYEVDGYQFRFEDESLQQRFIKAYEHFDKILNIPLKQPVGYIDAKSMVSGNVYEKLSKILDQYESRDIKTDRKGRLHKYRIFDEISKETKNKTIHQYTKLYDDYKAQLDKVTDQSNDIRYNIVYYLNGFG